MILNPLVSASKSKVRVEVQGSKKRTDEEFQGSKTNG